MSLASFFLGDRRGNVAPIFALAIIPVIGLVGAAIDYGRANSIRTALQSSLDATTLAMAKVAPTVTESELQRQANAYFRALLNQPEAKDVTLRVNYSTSGGSSLSIDVAGSVDTTFMRIMGYSKLSIGSSSTVQWGNQRLRVALALDNTGSMSSAGKMTALKTAAKNLLDQLRDAASKNGDVYVSIIPFSKDVNVDSVNYSRSWVRWDLWDAENGSCKLRRSRRRTSVPTDSATCLLVGGRWTSDNHNNWNGCVTDRDRNYDTTNTPPASTVATRFPAEQYSSCPTALMGLSYDWAALDRKIDAMSPDGNTNQAIGLQWAFQSLTSDPLTVPPMDPNYQYQQVIILLTDGLNTQDRWYTDQSSIDARQKITCDNVKAKDITLYTIQVNTDGDPTSSLLKSCASDSAKFFLLTSSNEIGTIFNQIGTTLSQLRIAK